LVAVSRRTTFARSSSAHSVARRGFRIGVHVRSALARLVACRTSPTGRHQLRRCAVEISHALSVNHDGSHCRRSASSTRESAPLLVLRCMAWKLDSAPQP
jgi:hypothetical protein